MLGVAFGPAETQSSRDQLGNQTHLRMVSNKFCSRNPFGLGPPVSSFLKRSHMAAEWLEEALVEKLQAQQRMHILSRLMEESTKQTKDFLRPAEPPRPPMPRPILFNPMAAWFVAKDGRNKIYHMRFPGMDPNLQYAI